MTRYKSLSLVHCLCPLARGTLAAALFLSGPAHAAQDIALLPTPPPANLTPSTPPATSFHDPRFKVAMDIPAGWSLATRDHLVSTFRLDARSATPSTQLRAVANISFNPYPESTFSGAFVYFSVTPHATDAACARQAMNRSAPPVPAPGLSFAHKESPASANIGGMSFNQGHDQHGNICVQARDEVYTTYRHGACFRFDLAMNNFCGGEVSGVRDMTPQEIEDIRQRMQNILTTVRFN